MKALTVMAAGGALIVALWAPAVGAEDSQRDREDRKEQQENRGRRGGEHHPKFGGLCTRSRTPNVISSTPLTTSAGTAPRRWS